MRRRTRLSRNAWIVVAALTLSASTNAAELTPQTAAAWTAYIEATEQRILAEHASDRGFLAQDFENGAARARVLVRRGHVLVSQVETLDSTSSAIAVPSGAIHHWRGSIFISGMSLDDILRGVNRPLKEHELQEDVLESRVLERHGLESKVFLKLRRQKLVTVHYNTEHEVRYARHDRLRAWSRSVAIKIAELRNPGTLQEEERPIGNDLGFLWRLNAYWRYEEVDGGVFVECESVSLSRSIPAAVRWMVNPLVRQTARESMERTLTSLRARMRSSHEYQNVMAVQ